MKKILLNSLELIFQHLFFTQKHHRTLI